MTPWEELRAAAYEARSAIERVLQCADAVEIQQECEDDERRLEREALVRLELEGLMGVGR